MPIYEYRCGECQQLFEEWCKHIEDEDVQHNCPICRGKAERLISQTSFALKGGGWYVTEYGSHKGIKEDGVSASCGDAPGKSADAPEKNADAPGKNGNASCAGGASACKSGDVAGAPRSSGPAAPAASAPPASKGASTAS